MLCLEGCRISKRDGRRLSHETSEEIRRLAVKRVVEGGERPSAVMRSYGLARTVIYRWLRAYRRGGEAALRSRKASGRPRRLAAKDLLKVRRMIDGHDPRHYGYAVALWTHAIVADLIRKKFRVRLSASQVGRLLKKVDVTPQKPLRRAYERDEKAIEAWKTQEYPRLKRRAKRNAARIFFSDEAGVRSDQVLGRTLGIRGRTPEVRTSGQRQSINAINALDARGAFWFETYSGRFNGGRFIELLGHFMRRRKGPIYLVLDRHPVHKAKKVLAYVKSLKGRLEFHFLPGYAPEVNPSEFPWNHLKNEGVAKTPLRQNESLRKRVDADLAQMQARPGLIQSFFKAPSVVYVMQ